MLVGREVVTVNRSDLESLRGLGLNTRGTMQVLDLNLFKTTDSNIVIRYLVDLKYGTPVLDPW